MTPPDSSRPPHAFARYWLPVLLYVGLIFTLSSIHGSSVPKLFPNVDKLEHLLEYSLFGLLAGRAIRFTLGATRRRLAAALGTMALGAVVGALDELYQRRVPGRSSDVRDWIVDVAAVGIAVLVTQLIHTRPIAGRGRPAARGNPDGSADSRNETAERMPR
jgi:VanZ family protein